MTEADQIVRNVKKELANRGRPHMTDFDVSAALTTSLRANGSRECAPDDRLREAIHRAAKKDWIASSLRSSQ